MQLGPCADPSGDFFEVRKKLEAVFMSAPSSVNRQLRTALDEMEGIVKLLGHIQIGRKIVFRPTLAHNAEVGTQCPPMVLEHRLT